MPRSDSIGAGTPPGQVMPRKANSTIVITSSGRVSMEGKARGMVERFWSWLGVRGHERTGAGTEAEHRLQVNWVSLLPFLPSSLSLSPQGSTHYILLCKTSHCLVEEERRLFSQLGLISSKVKMSLTKRNILSLRTKNQEEVDQSTAIATAFELHIFPWTSCKFSPLEFRPRL